MNEKADHTDLPPLQKVDKLDTTSPQAKSPINSDMPKPLSPNKLKPSPLNFDPPPTGSVDSPTTAGVTDRIDKLDVDEDTVMTEFGEDPIDSDEDGPSDLEKELARSADKPAPLFAKKEPPAPITIEQTEEPQDIDQSIATIQGEEASTLPNGERAPYETETDGRPVVGDMLKIQFVAHQVVPTILVSLTPRHTLETPPLRFSFALRFYFVDALLTLNLTSSGLLLPLSLEQLPPQRSLRCRPTSLQRHPRPWLQPNTGIRPLHSHYS